MILLALFRAFAAVVGAALSLLPSFPVPDISTALSSVSSSEVWKYASWANWYIPLDLGLTLLAARITVALGLAGFEAFVWVLTKLHILGGE